MRGDQRGVSGRLNTSEMWAVQQQQQPQQPQQQQPPNKMGPNVPPAGKDFFFLLKVQIKMVVGLTRLLQGNDVFEGENILLTALTSLIKVSEGFCELGWSLQRLFQYWLRPPTALTSSAKTSDCSYELG